MPAEKDIRYMGYSVRWREGRGDPGWRCTAWLGWNMTRVPRYDMEDVVGLELYDHSSDPGENFNLAGEKYYSWVVHHCFTLIRSYIK